MKKDYDLTNGVRGKFYSAEAEFNLPIYLDPEISEFVDRLAADRSLDRNTLVNLLLKKDKEMIEISGAN